MTDRCDVAGRESTLRLATRINGSQACGLVFTGKHNNAVSSANDA